MSASQQKMMALLGQIKQHPNGGNVTISFGPTTITTKTVTSNGSSVISYSNSMSFSDGAMELNGHYYSFDDPAAVDKMSAEHKQLFWSLCSDKGKDSDSYRSYASGLLKEAQINIDDLPGELHLLVINSAKKINELAVFCLSLGATDWLKKLSHNKPSKLERVLKQSDEIVTVLKALQKLRYSEPLTTLMQIKKEKRAHYKEMLTSGYNTAETLNGLQKLGYKDPLTTLVALDITLVPTFLKKYYDTFQAINGLAKLGYKNALDLFFSLKTEEAELLTTRTYDSFQVMGKLQALGDRKPLNSFWELTPANRETLLKHTYDSFELIEFFASSGYASPL